MKRSLISALFLLTISTVFAQRQNVPTVALSLSGGPSLPFGTNASLFKPGYFATAKGEYFLSGADGLALAFALGYDRIPVEAGPRIDAGLAAAGGVFALPLGKLFAARAWIEGGAYYCAIAGAEGYSDLSVTSTPGPYASAGLSFAITAIPRTRIELGASYRGFLGLYDGIGISFAASIGFDAPIKKAAGGGARIVPLSSSALKVDKIEFDSVFPVFFKYYDDHPLGELSIANSSKDPISDISVSFNVKQYMDAPKACAAIASLKPGESAAIRLSALFTDKMLEITEATVVSADLALTFSYKGQEYQATASQGLRILDRNAMDWSDDRHPAAFVTAKDPAVLSFAKNVVGSIKDSTKAAVDKKLQEAMAIHEALDLYGLSYVVDPQSSYAANSKDGKAVDFLQFPRQTLEYKSGDCDDLSILYCALLESVGVETAFITVPGHIFAAFRLEAAASDAARRFSKPDDLVLREDGAWLPVEITDRTGGFIQAWQEGAKEWRDGLAHSNAGFYPLHQAWLAYEPVGLPGSSPSSKLPEGPAIAARFSAEMGKYVDQELFAQAASLQAAIDRSQGSPKSFNALGVLYARYGIYDKAEGFFAKAIESGDYAPAVMNLGNVSLLRKEYSKAEDCYRRALALEPGSAIALLGMAKVGHEREDFAGMDKYFAALKKASPETAAKYAYLDSGSGASARAANLASEMDAGEWSE